jgi:hypothetical protein
MAARCPHCGDPGCRALTWDEVLERCAEDLGHWPTEAEQAVLRQRLTPVYPVPPGWS